MKVWGLYSSRVDPYHRWELIELFTLESEARRVRDLLAGKPYDRHPFSWNWKVDDTESDFNDLHVCWMELR